MLTVRIGVFYVNVGELRIVELADTCSIRDRASCPVATMPDDN
jgi:hypothetical protein